MKLNLKPFVDAPVCYPCPEHGAPQRMADTNDWLAADDDMGNGMAAFRHEGHGVFPYVSFVQRDYRKNPGRTVMKLNVTIVAGALFVCSLHGVADQALNRAVTDGAKAKLVLHVADQEGKAVEGATVKCWLWRNYSDGGPLGLDLITDRNGHCTAEGKMHWSGHMVREERGILQIFGRM